MSYTQQLDDILKVTLQESFLFDEEELNILVSYRSLPQEARLLFFYLLQRAPDVRLGDLEGYSDKIPAWKDAIDLLIESNFVSSFLSDSIHHGLELLKKDELTSLAKKRKLTCNSKTLREALLEYSNKQTEIHFGKTKKPRNRILHDIHEIIGQIVNIPVYIRQIFLKVSVIYSREQEIPEKPFLNSILTNLNSDHRKNFPTYKIQRLEGLIWSTREEFCRYYESLESEEYCRKLETLKNWDLLAKFCETQREEWAEYVKNYTEHVTGITWLKVFSAGHVLTRIMEFGVAAFFRLKEYQIQVDLLQSLISQNVFLIEHKGRWYDELTKITDLYLDKSYAKQCCLDALSDENVISRRRLSIVNRAKKLFKKNNDIIFDKILQDINVDSFPKSTLLAQKVPGGTSGNKALYLDSVTSQLLSVENLALAHFKSKGWKGSHSENSILKTIFGLLFWDILFMDMPGVFISPYQNAPLDLGSFCFYESRIKECESRLNSIRNGESEAILCETYSREKGKFCVGVDWNSYSCTDLLEIINCMGHQPLCFICTRFAKHYRLYSGGMPDLCLWRADFCEIKFVEVKGPGDRLSEKQILWINDFIKMGIPAEILLVETLNNE